MNNRLLLPLLLAAVTAGAANLTVNVAGIKSPNGKIQLAAYKTGENFLKTPAFVTQAEIVTNAATATLHDLPAGDYAVSIYQDINSNNKLDTNFMGIPSEPYGFSNNVVSHFGPPSFAESKFAVPETGTTVSITLR